MPLKFLALVGLAQPFKEPPYDAEQRPKTPPPPRHEPLVFFMEKNGEPKEVKAEYVEKKDKKKKKIKKPLFTLKLREAKFLAAELDDAPRKKKPRPEEEPEEESPIQKPAPKKEMPPVRASLKILSARAMTVPSSAPKPSSPSSSARSSSRGGGGPAFGLGGGPSLGGGGASAGGCGWRSSLAIKNALFA